ncbi:MAG: YifB family Mg chelatase-like AAA ATPase [Eubacteriales bacterium]|nr:YifB family Mg chelatase-like AAA ATPase [Eubacteriales bacterium]
MFCTVQSAAVFGADSIPVHVEADVGDGLPSFAMVGFLSAQVKEAQERVRTAMKNAGLKLEPKRVTVNLSPADMRKCGTGFDLPIAVALAAAYGKIPANRLQHTLIAGELSLNGAVLPIPGVLAIAEGALKQGCDICVIPEENVPEAAAIEGIKAIGVTSLRETVEYLKGNVEIIPGSSDGIWEENFSGGNAAVDFSDIHGQEAAKRAIEVAVSGFHNLLMIGPPGSGKSLLARAIPGILPQMSREESMEISKIYSISGKLPERRLMTQRPFRAPHSTITPGAMTGGGRFPKPGEVSLAHNGVLFLDELPEFSKDTLEVLRQPLEDREICIARNGGIYHFPSDFMLAGAMNPCPCGHYPDLNKCNCTYPMIQRYLGRISGPFLERIDLTIEVKRIDYTMIRSEKREENSETIRERVRSTRKIQEMRYRDMKYRFNSSLDQSGIRKFCRLGKEEEEFMRQMFEDKHLSARTYYRSLKVARTIADMEESENIKLIHLQEAFCYRNANEKYWMGR